MGILSWLFGKKDNGLTEAQSKVAKTIHVGNDLIEKHGKAWYLYDAWDPVGAYKTLPELCKANDLVYSSVYKAWKDNRLYKDRFSVKKVVRNKY